MWFDDNGNPQYKLHADPDSPSSRFRQQEELRRLEHEASQLTVGAGRRQGQQIRFEPASMRRGDGAAIGEGGTPSAGRRRAPPRHFYDDEHSSRFDEPQAVPAGASSSNRDIQLPVESALEALFQLLPHLSASFRCSDADAMVLLGAVSNASAGGGGGGYGHSAGASHVGHLEDRLSIVEAENRALMARLEGRTDECDKLKDDLGEARQKLRAVQQQTAQSAQLLSQRRDEVRKQLLLEEGRTQKLQQQNKLLTQEIDKLKQRLHTAMQR
jgi:hypothetical protein